LQKNLANSVPKWKYDEAMKLGREQDLALNDLENKLAVTEANTELFREVHLSAYNKEKNRIKQLKQDIAITEANTELFREVHLSAYNKMIKIKEIIGC
jgi:DNA-binding Xre family transcriptional regulator